MSKLEKFRKIMALPEVIQNVELTEQLKDIFVAYFELLEKNNEMSAKLKEIDDISEIKKKAKINSGFYTLDGIKDIHGAEICFCLNCLYEHKLQIPMAFGIIERGVQEYYSGEVLKKNLYGLSCKKCGTKLTASKKENNNND
jgi:hypothetical protein